MSTESNETENENETAYDNVEHYQTKVIHMEFAKTAKRAF